MKVLISLVLLLLTSSCECGLIDGVFGAVTNTTHDVAHNVGGIFSFGQGLIFGEKKNVNPTEAGTVAKHTKGLLGGLFDSVHDNVKKFEERIKNVFTNKHTNDNGVLGNMVDRVQKRVVNIKEFIFGSVKNPQVIVNKTHDNVVDKVKPIRDHLNNFIFGNRTKNNNFNDMIKVLEDIKRKLNDIRNNTKTEITKPDFNGKPEDGTGLIDIRASFDEIKDESEKSDKGNYMRNVHGRYDISNVAKQGDKLKNNIKKSFNDIESNIKDTLDRDKQIVDGAYKNINEDALVFRN